MLGFLAFFLTANHFPLSTSSVLPGKIVQPIQLTSRVFFIAFFVTSPDSERLVPSSGLKIQLICIILLPKKLSLYLQHLLRIYVIK